MEQNITIGLGLAKHVFQAHGADRDGAVVIRKKLRREQVLGFFAELSRCTVALEVCGGAHHWAREIGRLGHEVKLIAPAYVKPFVKRQKNDMPDAEAICEAAQTANDRAVAAMKPFESWTRADITQRAAWPVGFGCRRLVDPEIRKCADGGGPANVAVW